MSFHAVSLDRATMYNGDCLDVMRILPDGCVDAIVTDPPAGINFMQKDFDSDRGGRDQWVAWLAERLAEARRVIRPGGFMLCWAIPRTSHWTAMAIEQAGWTIRERVAHIFGTGFPKSKSCLKPAVEDWWLCKAPGKLLPLEIERSRIGTEPIITSGQKFGANSFGSGVPDGTGSHKCNGTEKSSHDGRYPANLCLSHHEDCVEIGSHVLRDDQRGEPGGHRDGGFVGVGSENGDGKQNSRVYGSETVTTWECVEGCPVRELGLQSGTLKSGKAVAGGHKRTTDKHRGTYAPFKGKQNEGDCLIGDSGTAARFFYQAKASRSDRNEGLDSMPDRLVTDLDKWATNDRREGTARHLTRWVAEPVKNSHPTVKSTALMQWLTRLITPEGGTVLDPFMGSGSTGKACMREGFRFVGIEQDTENGYFEIARRRIEHEAKKIDGDMPLFSGLNT